MVSQLCRICDLSSDKKSGTSGGKNVSFDEVLGKVLSGEADELQGSDGNTASAAKGTSYNVSSFSNILSSYNKYLSGAASTDTSSEQTASTMQVSDDMVNFIASHEGFSSTPYRGADSQNLTIGYGHVIGSGESYTSITKTEALSLMKKDLNRFVSSVNKEFSDTKLSQNQFDSLVSFSYNLGAYIWDKVPTLVNDIKSGASAETLKTDFAGCDRCNGVELKGLLKRRLDEWATFVTPNSST